MRYEVQKRYSVFYIVGSLASACAGILAFGIMQMQGIRGYVCRKTSHSQYLCFTGTQAGDGSSSLRYVMRLRELYLVLLKISGNYNLHHCLCWILHTG